MLSHQNDRYICLANAATAATNGTLTGVALVDTKGFNSFSVIVVPEGSTTAPSVLQLQHSDTTDATNFAGITGLIGGTNSANGFTIAAVSSSTQSVVPYVFNVLKKGKTKRYVRIAITPGATGQSFTAFAVLHGDRAVELPNTTTEQNAATIVNVDL